MPDIDVRFHEEDWQRIERDWCAWWAGELERPLVGLEIIEPQDYGVLETAPEFASNLPFDMPAEEVIERYTTFLETTHFLGDAFPKWWLNFGPGVGAGFLGANVKPAPDTVWFEPQELKPIRDLHFGYDAENPWWRRVQELTALAVERWGDRVVVGHTDIGGNLDILSSFRTPQGLLLDLYDAPQEVDRLVGEITTVWLRYYDELAQMILPAGRGTSCWAPVWSPGTTYMLQSDFSYMISPKMFERFVLPDLYACCENLEHAFYHLDGKGEIAHLDMLLSLDRLRGIQWVPGDGAPPPEDWLPLLKRIRDGGKLCQVMVTAEGARKIVREIGGKGFILAVYDPSLSLEEGQAFLETLAVEGGWERA